MYAAQLQAPSFQLGIDCSPLTLPARGSGVRRYTEEVLIRARPPFWPTGIRCFTKGAESSSLIGRLNKNLSDRPTEGGSFFWRHIELPRAAAREGIEMMWFPYHPMPFRFGLPNVVTVHDISYSVLPNARRTFGGNYQSLMLHRALAQAHHIITVSEFTAAELMRVYKVPAKRITPILHGVSVHGPAPVPDRWPEIANLIGINSPFFLYLGGGDPRKNFPFLVNYLRRHPEILKSYQFVITGSPAEALQMLYNSGLSEQIGKRLLLPGLVSEEVLDGLYRKTWGLLYLSLYEGFGMPMVEAFARECPVVALRASCLPEIAGDAAIFVEPEDFAGLDVALRSLSEESGRIELIRLGNQRLEKFDWQACADKTGATICNALTQ